MNVTSSILWHVPGASLFIPQDILLLFQFLSGKVILVSFGRNRTDGNYCL